MRRILPLLLLFAVCLHTAWGWPSHMASHLPGHVSHAAQGLFGEEAAREAPTAPAEDPAEEGAAHAACTWCAAHAQLAFGLSAHRPSVEPARVQSLVRPQRLAGHGFHQAQHWPFASRDPPAVDSL